MLDFKSPCVRYHLPARPSSLLRWGVRLVAVGLFALGSQTSGNLSMMLLLGLLVGAYIGTESWLYFSRPLRTFLRVATIKLDERELAVRFLGKAPGSAEKGPQWIIERARIQSASRHRIQYNLHELAWFSGLRIRLADGVNAVQTDHGLLVSLDTGELVEIATGAGEEGARLAGEVLDVIRVGPWRKAALFTFGRGTVRVGLDGVQFLTPSPEAWRDRAFLPWETLEAVQHEGDKLRFETTRGVHWLHVFEPLLATALVERCSEARASWAQARGELSAKAPPTRVRLGDYRSDNAHDELQGFLRVGSGEQRKAAAEVLAGSLEGRDLLDEARESLADEQTRGALAAMRG